MAVEATPANRDFLEFDLVRNEDAQGRPEFQSTAGNAFLELLDQEISNSGLQRLEGFDINSSTQLESFPELANAGQQQDGGLLASRAGGAGSSDASQGAELLAALDQRTSERSGAGRDAYRQEHGYDPSEGWKGQSWDERAQAVFENEGRIFLMKASDDPVDSTAPSGTGGMTFSEARQAMGEINQRYEAESASASLSPEAQMAYIDEQLRVLDEYERNPGDTPGEYEEMAVEQARGFLNAEHDVLQEVAEPPKHEPAPDVLPDPPEGEIDPTREGSEPIVDGPAVGPDQPVNPENPEGGDTDPDEPEDDDPGNIAMPNPVDDPQPGGGSFPPILNNGGTAGPATVTPVPIEIDFPDVGNFPPLLNDGGRAGPGTVRPADGFIDIDVLELDPRFIVSSSGAGPATTTPVDEAIGIGTGGAGGGGLTPTGPDPRATVSGLGASLENIELSEGLFEEFGL